MLGKKDFVLGVSGVFSVIVTLPNGTRNWLGGNNGREVFFIISR